MIDIIGSRISNADACRYKSGDLYYGQFPKLDKLPAQYP